MKSMTGYGRAQAALPDGTQVSVTVRSVNHRFLDLSLKMRDDLGALEAPLRKLVSQAVARGHVDLSVRVSRPAGGAVSLDGATAGRYADEWRRLAETNVLPAELTARDLLSLPGVVRVGEDEAGESLGATILETAGAALADFDGSRSREGEALKAALAAVLDRLDAGISRVDEAREGLAERLLAQLRERVAKLAAGVPLDEARLAQEVALLADRADITEEIDRFRAHLVEARRLMSAGGAFGKRLDVLSQELHREANTSSQKARELPLTRVLLDLKSDVEALKEQIQNVE
jgi:uncharacterized protein (TIGR00255 family)